jgi:hypothetical protein
LVAAGAAIIDIVGEVSARSRTYSLSAGATVVAFSGIADLSGCAFLAAFAAVIAVGLEVDTEAGAII